MLQEYIENDKDIHVICNKQKFFTEEAMKFE